ncbi:MAG: flagellar hook-associated protein FlgK [Kiritimatiellae bacterium]|nr:flagellar hook-associated protein FlgK [Kiritimatiellia bacterium]
MSSLSDITTVARSGVLAQQENLNVIAHNITNVNTKGYHRQSAVLTTNPANMPNISTTIPYSQGTGVTVSDVLREYDLLRERALLDERSGAAKDEFLANQLPDLESILLTDTENGLAQTLTQFWTAWQDVAAYPDNITMRNVALEKGAQLASVLNKAAGSLQNYRDGIASGISPNITGSVADEVNSLNTMTAELQNLNRKITLYENSRVSTADLEDRRDLLVADIAKQAEIAVDADYNISIDGQLLLSADGLTRNTLNITTADPLTFDVNGAAVNIEQGVIGGWNELTGYIESLGDNLDTLAAELITQVNALHTSGYDLDGNLGLDFFTGGTASDISVNAALYNAGNPLLNNPRLIAAAQTLYDPGGPNEGPNTGDGAVALAIADLSGDALAALGNQSFNQYYTQLTTNLGTQIGTFESLAESGASTIAALENAIQSESGVSLDEELIHMITAQRAYQAASKLLSESNTMFDVLMSITR